MSYLTILLMSLQNYFILSNKCIRVYSMDVPNFFLMYMKTISAIFLLQITLCIHVYILPCTSMTVFVGWIPRSRTGPKWHACFVFYCCLLCVCVLLFCFALFLLTVQNCPPYRFLTIYIPSSATYGDYSLWNYYVRRVKLPNM